MLPNQAFKQYMAITSITLDLLLLLLKVAAITSEDL